MGLKLFAPRVPDPDRQNPAFDRHGRRLTRIIGHGATAEVVQISPDAVLKVFKPMFDSAFVEREYALSSFAYSSGIATPRPIEVTSFDGRLAIEFEYVPGPSLDQQLWKRVWRMSRYMRQFADLHAEIHNTDATSLSGDFAQRELYRSLICASTRLGDMRQGVLSALNQVPAGTSLCHGDFSTGNVIVSRYGPKVIDWSQASVGDPAADVANSWLGSGELIPRSQMNFLVKLGSLRAIRQYRQRYLEGKDQSFSTRVQQWLLPVAAAKLGAQEMVGVREDFLAILTDFIVTNWGKDGRRLSGFT